MYFRNKVSESPRYTANVLGDPDQAARDMRHIVEGVGGNEEDEEEGIHYTHHHNKKKGPTFRQHFGKWRNLKILLGVSVSWFALDVGFYGTNLNTP